MMKKILIIISLLFCGSLNANQDNLIIYLMDNNKEMTEGISLIESQKYDKALMFFNQKAKEGVSGAYVNAGIMYEHYYKDDEKAFLNYQKSAELKNAKGQYNYGVLLYFLNKDVVNSYKFNICSASQGYDEAAFILENMKAQKLITDKEIKEAIKLSDECK